MKTLRMPCVAFLGPAVQMCAAVVSQTTQKNLNMF
jgi:hypothetical protein